MHPSVVCRVDEVPANNTGSGRHVAWAVRPEPEQPKLNRRHGPSVPNGLVPADEGACLERPLDAFPDERLSPPEEPGLRNCLNAYRGREPAMQPPLERLDRKSRRDTGAHTRARQKPRYTEGEAA